MSLEEGVKEAFICHIYIIAQLNSAILQTAPLQQIHAQRLEFNLKWNGVVGSNIVNI